MEIENRDRNLAKLSFNLWSEIFEFLDQKEIYFLGAACKRLKLLSEIQVNRKKFNELVFVKGMTGEIFTLNLDSMLISKHFDLPHKLCSYGSIYIPYNQSTFFYGGWIGTTHMGETFLVDKHKNITQLCSGPPTGGIGLVYYNKFIYAIGGHNSSISVKYNLALNIWESFASLKPESKLKTSCALIKENILFVRWNLSSLMSYSINNDSFESISTLTLRRNAFKNIHYWSPWEYLFRQNQWPYLLRNHRK